MIVQEPVQAAIWQSLNHYDFADAIFLAERLYAEVGSDETVFLLATCYYRSGKPRKARSFLQSKGCPNAQCKYLMAQCCLDIKKYDEAENYLTGNILHKTKSHEDIINEMGDSAPYAMRLLGRIYNNTERREKAAEAFKRSLNLNPFQWSSFESLCNLGENPDPSKIYKLPSQQQLTNLCQVSTPVVSSSPQPLHPAQTNISTDVTPLNTATNCESKLHETPQIMMSLPVPQIISQTPDHTDYKTPDMRFDMGDSGLSLGGGSILGAPGLHKKERFLRRQPHEAMQGLSPFSPSFGIMPLENTPSPQHHNIMVDNTVELKAPSKKPMTRRQQQLTAHGKPPVFSMSGNTNNTNTIKDSPSPGSGQGGLRRSSRLFSASSSSVKENNKSQSQKFVNPKAPAKKSKERKSLKSSKSPMEMNEVNKEKSEHMSENKPHTIPNVQTQVAVMQRQSAEGLLNLMQNIGRAYGCLSQYDCTRALQLFNNLPVNHLDTGWVQCSIGRAYFELADYQKAEKTFQEVRRKEPHHIEGMEIFSTALWHLQREVELSVLAQELTSFDKESPEAWCTTGNCFSLEKEHDVAIKFFQRAVQVDPDFAYAYTLLGHEYVATEELDKAMDCFRNAIRVDPRHYNAWYGVGMIYYKQEKFSQAEYHFRKALQINPQSSVLLCHVGVVQHALKKSEAALQTLNKAITANPKNPLCKFHRASILFANDRHKEALKELEELKQIVPRESLVYFLIGKVHKKLGNTHLSLMNFSWAMDLDPKGANNQIKEAIDKRYVTDEEDPGAAGDDIGLDDHLEVGSSNNSSIMEDNQVQLHANESDESL